MHGITLYVIHLQVHQKKSRVQISSHLSSCLLNKVINCVRQRVAWLCLCSRRLFGFTQPLMTFINTQWLDCRWFLVFWINMLHAYRTILTTTTIEDCSAVSLRQCELGLLRFSNKLMWLNNSFFFLIHYPVFGSQFTQCLCSNDVILTRFFLLLWSTSFTSTIVWWYPRSFELHIWVKDGRQRSEGRCGVENDHRSDRRCPCHVHARTEERVRKKPTKSASVIFG
jgi:hypothetical protein